MEVSVLSEDVSTFLMFAPEEEYLGAKVTGFVPREDGTLSALEMHGQVWCTAGVKRTTSCSELGCRFRWQATLLSTIDRSAELRSGILQQRLSCNALL